MRDSLKKMQSASPDSARSLAVSALAFIAADPKASQATFALKMGWKLFNGDPNKVKAGRCIKRLVDTKLINVTRAGNYTLTDKGKAALEEVEK